MEEEKKLTINITEVSNGELCIQIEKSGFNEAEGIGIVELVKADMINSMLKGGVHEKTN